MAPRVYLDNAASTPVDPRVLSAMLPWLGEACGNPGSLHAEGRHARAAVEEARAEVAALLGADADEIVLTGSGTEADNLAILGAAAAFPDGEAHVVVSAIEHPSVLEPARRLSRLGVGVTFLPCGADGIVDPADLARALRPSTRLVSVMAANNVTGTLQPITELSRVARSHGALFHTDAVQAAGKVPLDVRRDPIDLLSLSAHKLHGPKGAGALYVRRGTPIAPLLHGGGQENGLRPATEAVPVLAGVGRAARLAREEMADEAVRTVALRERLVEGVLSGVEGASLVGHRFRRLPGHACFLLDRLEGEAVRLLLDLDEAGIAVSSGSACSARHADRPSHVLTAMGFDAVKARGSLRVSLGRFSTGPDVDAFVAALSGAAARLRRRPARASARA